MSEAEQPPMAESLASRVAALTPEKEDTDKSRVSADHLGSDTIALSDNLELLYKFIFDPRSNYQEITKLWSLTNLSQADFVRLQQLAKSIRILDKKTFYQKTSRENVSEYKADADGVVQPVFFTQVFWESRFINLIERFIGEIDAICAGAGGRQGSLIRAFRTATNKHEHSMEEKSATKRTIWGRGFGGGGN